LAGVMITAAANDLNAIEFVSRDTERIAKKRTESDGCAGDAMKRCARRPP
jgi:hypothetical protein